MMSRPLLAGIEPEAPEAKATTTDLRRDVVVVDFRPLWFML